MTTAGFPHSDIHGSMLACSSPWLFAACCVLRRLLAPRHPPYALTNLTCVPTAYKRPSALLSVRAFAQRTFQYAFAHVLPPPSICPFLVGLHLIISLCSDIAGDVNPKFALVKSLLFAERRFSLQSSVQFSRSSSHLCGS